jgi:hypothetical protein
MIELIRLFITEAIEGCVHSSVEEEKKRVQLG